MMYNTNGVRTVQILEEQCKYSKNTEVFKSGVHFKVLSRVFLVVGKRERWKARGEEENLYSRTIVRISIGRRRGFLL